MTYKKVTPISKGVLRIRSEPDESGRMCGSVSYGEEVTVETTKVTSKKGKEYYRLACEIGMTDGNIVVREA